MHSNNFYWAVDLFVKNIVFFHLAQLNLLGFLKVLEFRWNFCQTVVAEIAFIIKFLLIKIILVQINGVFFRFYVFLFLQMCFQSEIFKYVFLFLEVKRKIFLYLLAVNLSDCSYQLYFVAFGFIMVIMFVYYVNNKNIRLLVLSHGDAVKATQRNSPTNVERVNYLLE